MMANRVAVLITRPLPQGERLAEDLRARWGNRVAVVLSPLMVPVFLTPKLPAGPFAALVLTSEVGAEAARHLPGLPRLCHCVGARTAEVARQAGFTPGLVAPTAAALIARLLEAETGPLLYLHGQDVSVRIDQRLTEAGRTAAAAVVYEQRAAPLSPEAAALVQGQAPVVVPLYSARSLRLLVSALPPGAAGAIWSCVISSAVAEALPPDWRSRAEVAETPDQPGMLLAMDRVISSLLG